MWHAEILKGGKRADGRRHQIISDEQKRADNRDNFAAMPHAGVNAAAVGIQAADDHVVEADECSKHAHRRDQPERSVTGDRERKPNDVGLARPPIAIKNRRPALPIHIARSLNVCWYQLIRLKRSVTRATRRLTSRSRISRHPLPFNDADEVSCRAGAIKCSRCRASFAPIRTAFAERNLVPPLDQPLADPLSETKNWRNLLTGKCDSQVSHSLPAHLEPFIGDEAIPDSRLGLNETWICRITFNLLAQVGDINAEILAVLSTSARRTTGNRSPRGSVVCGGRPA